jgi:hypothetical protein
VGVALVLVSIVGRVTFASGGEDRSCQDVDWEQQEGEATVLTRSPQPCQRGFRKPQMSRTGALAYWTGADWQARSGAACSQAGSVDARGEVGAAHDTRARAGGGLC